MDRQALVKKLMDGYDGVWTKAIAAKRASKANSTVADADTKPLDDSQPDDGMDAEPDADVDDSQDKAGASGKSPIDPWKVLEDGMDDETKEKLKNYLSQ